MNIKKLFLSILIIFSFQTNRVDAIDFSWLSEKIHVPDYFKEHPYISAFSFLVIVYGASFLLTSKPKKKANKDKTISKKEFNEKMNELEDTNDQLSDEEDIENNDESETFESKKEGIEENFEDEDVIVDDQDVETENIGSQEEEEIFESKNSKKINVLIKRRTLTLKNFFKKDPTEKTLKEFIESEEYDQLRDRLLLLTKTDACKQYKKAVDYSITENDLKAFKILIDFSNEENLKKIIPHIFSYCVKKVINNNNGGTRILKYILKQTAWIDHRFIRELVKAKNIKYLKTILNSNNPDSKYWHKHSQHVTKLLTGYPKTVKTSDTFKAINKTPKGNISGYKSNHYSILQMYIKHGYEKIKLECIKLILKAAKELNVNILDFQDDDGCTALDTAKEQTSNNQEKIINILENENLEKLLKEKDSN